MRLGVGLTYGVFWGVNKVKSMRVAPQVEEEGLDYPEFGMGGYPEDAVIRLRTKDRSKSGAASRMAAAGLRHQLAKDRRCQSNVRP